MTVRSPAATGVARELDSVAPGETATAGAKGATLAALQAAGLPVPAGFVIEAAAYKAFVAETGLSEHIAERLEALDVDDAAARRQAAADIHVGIVATPLPGRVHDEIVEAYLSLTGRDPVAAVAVRSSTTTQDTASHRLAHMNETFLCVRGASAVVSAVRRCWASLFDERSLLIRAKLGWARAPLDLAVVVQRQVFATRSGVMSTSGPAGDRRERVVIEASYGLGQASAAGLVTPDLYVADKRSLKVLTREIHRKDLAVDEAPPSGGTRRRAVVGEQVARPALRDSEVGMLAELAARVEDELGGPQVVEWALDRHGKAWILQSTPLGLPA